MANQVSVGISEQELSEMLESRFPGVTSSSPNHLSISPRPQGIHRVSPLLRMKEETGSAVSVYEPIMFPLGPYHHVGKPPQVEEFKYICLQFYFESNDAQKTMLYNTILAKIDQIRECYSDVDRVRCYDDHDLAIMMLLDVCFILNFMEVNIRNVRQNRPNSLSVAAGNRHMARDIMVMENQIPLFVLQMLINTVYDNETEAKRLICYFFTMMLSVPLNEMHIALMQENENPSLHILEACWRLIKDGSLIQYDEDSSYKHKISSDQLHSATELGAKSIHFRPSPLNSVKGVKFDSHLLYGMLQLPCRFLSDITDVMLSNMIAYEVSLNDGGDMTVVSYVQLMKSLVQTPADVKVLQAARIIRTIGFSNPEQVVDLFKKINTIGIGNSPIYRDVMARIQDHCERKAISWTEKMITNYFRSNPWKGIGLLTGTLLIVLTFLQTYYTIHPN